MASPTHAAAVSGWLFSGAGRAAFYSQNSLAGFVPHRPGFQRAARFLPSRSRALLTLCASSLTGNNTVPPVPGPLRAAISHLGRPFFLQGRNNLIYHFIKSFRFWRIGPGSFLSPQARAFSLISRRASQPIAVTRIFCDRGSRSFKFLNGQRCTAWPVVIEKYQVRFHESENRHGAFARAQKEIAGKFRNE